MTTDSEASWSVRALVLLLLAQVGFAQEPPQSSPLECLEAQRVLVREFRRAREAGDHAAALSACEKLLRLEHLVPLPGDGSSGSPRDRLRTLANELVRGKAKKAFQTAVAERRKAWGQPCRLCKGAGSFLCTRCRGKGVVKMGRKDVPCDALFPCLECRGSGRAGSPPIAADLERIAKAARVVVNTQDDLLGMLKATFERLPRDLDPRGFREVDRRGKPLRDTVPEPPFDAKKLTGKERRNLTKLWDKSSAEERRAFVRGVILDSLRFGKTAACLAAPSAGDLRRALKDAEAVDASRLVLGGEELHGRFFSVTTKVAAPKPLADHPFAATQLSFEAFDPVLIVAHWYDGEAKKRLTAARRYAILETAGGLAQAYPFSRMERAAPRLEIGQRVKLTGRLLLRPGYGPARLFEVWGIEVLKEGGR